MENKKKSMYLQNQFHYGSFQSIHEKYVSQ